MIDKDKEYKPSEMIRLHPFFGRWTNNRASFYYFLRSQKMLKPCRKIPLANSHAGYHYYYRGSDILDFLKKTENP